ncbi:D-2-hydroxyacid dehydrogenase [Oceanobacillus luteolus]|uniref:D-2-hydroxyacid dehydrogenase n=1 Tax=Oceanobacillus luteolus TaxID=1274358 RepID=A0ABW4HNA2_9BACI
MLIICSIPQLTDEQMKKLKSLNDKIYFTEDIHSNTHTVPYDKAEIFITFGYDIQNEMLDRMENLKWIHIFQTGIEHLPIDDILKRDITLTHTKDIHGIPIGEYVLSMILYSVRDIPRFLASKHAKYWDEREPRIEEAHGKTVAVFGTGSVGRDIAKKLKALSMQVIGVNTSGKSIEHFDETYKMEDKHIVLGKSDFVVLILPATKDTYHCIGEEEFKSMKNNCFIINVGRGSLIDTDALIDNLLKRRIKGAALDVFDEEPLPATSPLWDLNNVFISPHIASLTDKYNDRCIDVFSENLNLFKEGKELKYRISFDNIVKRGY